MTKDAPVSEKYNDRQWYRCNIPIRNCELSLAKIKAAYRELSNINQQYGETLIRTRTKSPEIDEEEFKNQNEYLLLDAFRLTVSIIGFDGETVYSENEEVFESKNLPLHIKTVFFTNETSFKRNANGEAPRNRFSIWMHFDKPPLFDPNPLVSLPTPNASEAEIYATEVAFFRAAQTIINEKINSHKKWYKFIHEKFSYDIILWILGMPLGLYWITVYNDYFFPINSKQSSFRVAFYIYGIGISLIIYRALFSYIKWALPLITLEENKDSATKHRIILGTILTGLFVSTIKSIIPSIFGL